MATTPPVPSPGAPPNVPGPVLIVAIPSDPASAAAFAAGNLFVFLCSPVGQKISNDAETAGKAVGDVIKGVAQDVVNIFRGIPL
jgi:hypothetical protein